MAELGDLNYVCDLGFWDRLKICWELMSHKSMSLKFKVVYGTFDEEDLDGKKTE